MENPAPGSRKSRLLRAPRRRTEFIMALEEGYQTVIGERGISAERGDNAQRIAIARAFLTNHESSSSMTPPPMLILDGTAYPEAMLRISEGRTRSDCSPALGLCRHADLILVLRTTDLSTAALHASFRTGPVLSRSVRGTGRTGGTPI